MQSCLPHQAVQVNGRSCGVLVADDESEIRETLEFGLALNGFCVLLASDGMEALELYRTQYQAIDVVLLDVRMPGLDGPQTLAAIQEITPQVRCCFMSGYLGTYTVQGLREMGATAVFVKPFRVAEVANVLGALAAGTARHTEAI